jgi:hypothetical protein
VAPVPPARVRRRASSLWQEESGLTSVSTGTPASV